MQLIKLTEIQTNPHQPRKHFDEQALAELAQSIKVEGVMSPIMVRPIGEKYEIVQGERRFRAAQKAGLTEIPSIIREADDQEAFHLAVIENIQREQMTPIEEAQAFMKYVEMGFTHEQIAEKVSKSRTYVTTKLRLLNLIPEVQEWIAEGRISEAHAKVLLTMKSRICDKTDVPRFAKGDKTDFEYFQIEFIRGFETETKITVKNVEQYVENLYFAIVREALNSIHCRAALTVREKDLKWLESERLESISEWYDQKVIDCIQSTEELIELYRTELVKHLVRELVLGVNTEKISDVMIEEYFELLAKTTTRYKRWEIFKALEEWLGLFNEYRTSDFDYELLLTSAVKRYELDEIKIC